MSIRNSLILSASAFLPMLAADTGADAPVDILADGENAGGVVTAEPTDRDVTSDQQADNAASIREGVKALLSDAFAETARGLPADRLQEIRWAGFVRDVCDAFIRFAMPKIPAKEQNEERIITEVVDHMAKADQSIDKLGEAVKATFDLLDRMVAKSAKGVNLPGGMRVRDLALIYLRQRLSSRGLENEARANIAKL